MANEQIASPESKVETTEVKTEPIVIEHESAILASPDVRFVNDIIKSGGESLKKCYQCATCSVVCNLTQDDKPFPRKEMIYAQWGLKDKLMYNPDVWLCHQCSDCTAYCPRGAKPGEVLNAVRKMTIEHYAVPKILGKAVGRPQNLVILFAIPVVIFFLILAGLGDLSNIPRTEAGQISYHEFLPSIYIDSVFVPIAFFAVVCFAIGISRYWKDMARASGKASHGGIASSLTSTIGEILNHTRFEKCNVTKDRKIAHFLVFYSFIGLAITTAWAVAYLYGPSIMKLLGLKPFSWMLGPSPYPLTDPLKWLANASAIGLLIGITLIVIYRYKNQEKAGLGSYYDWLLITIIYLIVGTGILAELFRLGDIAILAYPIYFIHLVVVFFLFAYAPFSKMAHMVYRTTAMLFRKQLEKSS